MFSILKSSNFHIIYKQILIPLKLLSFYKFLKIKSQEFTYYLMEPRYPTVQRPETKDRTESKEKSNYNK